MGAWGSEPFENDHAMDWRYLLVDRAGPLVVGDALRAVLGLGPAEPSGGCAGLSGCGGGRCPPWASPIRTYPMISVIGWAGWIHRPGRRLPPEAIRALGRVLTESEFRDM